MILVTEATGFVGSALVGRLIANRGCSILVAVRREAQTLPKGVRQVEVGELFPYTDWSQALQDVDAVVHCAARVHVMQDESADPL